MSCSDSISFTSDQKTNYNCCSRYRSPCRPVIQKATNFPTLQTAENWLRVLSCLISQIVAGIFGSQHNIFYVFSSKVIMIDTYFGNFLFRLFGSHSRMCARCHGDITCNDLVMKARHCVFHVECFKCAQCDTSLRKGNAETRFKYSFTLCSIQVISSGCSMMYFTADYILR